VGKFRSLGHVAGSILVVSLRQVFWWTNQRATSPKGKKKDVSTNYYFMLVLISEKAHSQFFFPLKRRHLIDPSPIFLEHEALPKIED
jgi:hypothetical protein